MYINTNYLELNKFFENDDPIFKVLHLVIKKMVCKISYINSVNKKTKKLESYLDSFSAIIFLPNGELVVSALDDNMVCFWNIGTESCYSTFKGHSNFVKAV